MTEVFIGLGANLPSRFGAPRETLEAAVLHLARSGLILIARSRWYESAPVPISDQPWFVNGVISAHTSEDVRSVLDTLHEIEEEFGRVRRERWEARVLDLDLVAYGTMAFEEGGEAGARVPHPRMHERRFVLEPMREIAPDWRHPVLGRTISELLETLQSDEILRPL